MTVVIIVEVFISSLTVQGVMRDTTRSEVLFIARYSAKWIAQFGKGKKEIQG